MSNQTLALLILVFPAAGALLLAGRGWRLPRAFTVVIGPGVVWAGNFVFLVVGWALVGLSSYLLIGFWYQRHSAVVAARKAFVMNVIGDVGMILGTFVIFVNSHAVIYSAVFGPLRRGNQCASNGFCDEALRRVTDTPSLELAAFLLLVGA